MTITSGIRIADRQIYLHKKKILSNVPENVVLASASRAGPSDGIFLGALFSEPSSHHVTSLGILRDVKFMACFRFKLWWMCQKMGSSGKEVPMETQFVLLENTDEDNGEETLYTVLLPLVEGPFRACLQGNERDELELCLESGDPCIRESSFTNSLFIGCGTDPFKTITDGIKSVQSHLQTFRHREEKKMPGMVDWFGWCTWDAFYTDVSAEGVEQGLKSLAQGGTPPKFVIIDDGWQSVGTDQKQQDTPEKELVGRLTHIKENHKFQKEGKDGERQEDPENGIKQIVQIAKQKYNLKYVYVWHAITGYWGGVKPGAKAMEHYESTLEFPVHNPGVLNHEPAIGKDLMALQGLGLVNPKQALLFYDELHSYLAAAGIDGVKVDVQCILESLGAGYGGRVALTTQYHRALDASVARNFKDNGIIACMSHNNDALYCSKQTAVIRASDDFYPRDPVTHTIHIASVAYNSVFLGEFMQPDWDMFHSVHPAAEYHAAARAIGGCPVYVSDKPGVHNFDLLRKLVLPDGSILRARLPGRPTADCLFNDPNRDGKSLLKIWNMNNYTGVLGVFNCQGAAWSNTDKKNVFHDRNPCSLTGSVRAKDVHLLSEAADDDWNGDCAIYSHTAGELTRLPKSAAFPISLKVLEKEIYTITPVKNVGAVDFAPIGLIDMFNAGGAIHELEYEIESGRVKICIHGCGRFGAYSSLKPTKCIVNSKQCDFSYDTKTGLLVLQLEEVSEGQLHSACMHLI